MFGRTDSAALEAYYGSLCADDQRAVEALCARGADLEQERHVVHCVEVPNARAAATVAALGAQWASSIAPPTEADPGWYVAFERYDRVLSATNVNADRHLFEVIASVHRGRYDGWEVEV